MEKGFDEQRWLLANNSVVNNVDEEEEDDEDDEEEEEETLSFVDLPQTQHSKTTQVEEKRNVSQEIQEDFNFCRSFSLKSEMCSADEVFFQGQILPLRHSVSSVEKRLLPSRSVSRSESMDRCYSTGLFSSRSSSNSSSSYSWSGNGSKSVSRNGSVNSLVNQQRGSHPKPPCNRFHSHPSPSPRIHNQGVLNFNPINVNCTKKSPMWSIFRLGLVTPPPEIVFHDFKTRVPNKRSNSRNSTNSNSSGSSVKEKKKKKRALFGASCKCSADAVDTVTSKVVKVGNESVIKSTKKQHETKKEMSHHRTFEWLKQLSLEAAAAREEA